MPLHDGPELERADGTEVLGAGADHAGDADLVGDGALRKFKRGKVESIFSGPRATPLRRNGRQETLGAILGASRRRGGGTAAVGRPRP